MAHTYSNLLFHIVFSTQGRARLINANVKSDLYAYIGSLIKEKKGKPIIINGTEDHIHLLVILPANVSVSEAMQFVKANSSRRMKQQFRKPFAWQTGFGVFGVSRSNVPAVARYIRDQEIHHAKFDFKREFESLLNKNGVEYNEQYLWE